MDDIKARRLLILEGYKIIEEEGFSVIINMWELGESVGLDKKQTRRNIEYLVEKRFFKWMTIGGGISPTIKIDDIVNNPEEFHKLFPETKKVKIPIKDKTEDLRVRRPKESSTYMVASTSTDPYIAVKEFFLSARKKVEEKKLCFVLMPFKEEQNEIYKNVIKPTVEKKGYICHRADDIYKSTPIMKDILENIKKANIIIGDLTGRNPNVFYELGMAHLIKYPERVILLTKFDEDIPFDLASFRHIKYNNTMAGAKKLENDLENYLHSVEQIPEGTNELRITNISNDENNFYITVKNQTRSDLISADYYNPEISKEKPCTVKIIIEKSMGITLLDSIVSNRPESRAKFVKGTGIDIFNEGQIKVTMDRIIKGTLYTFILIAVGIRVVEQYRAI